MPHSPKLYSGEQVRSIKYIRVCTKTALKCYKRSTREDVNGIAGSPSGTNPQDQPPG